MLAPQKKASSIVLALGFFIAVAWFFTEFEFTSKDHSNNLIVPKAFTLELQQAAFPGPLSVPNEDFPSRFSWKTSSNEGSEVITNFVPFITKDVRARPKKQFEGDGTFISQVTAYVPEQSVHGKILPGDFYIMIESRTSSGRKTNACGTLYEVRIDGPALHLPTVTCDSQGSAWAKALLVEPGSYNVSVRFIQQLSLDVRGPRICFDAWNASGYILGGPDVNATTFQLVVANVTTRDTVPEPGPARTCEPDVFYSGRWVRESTNYSTARTHKHRWQPHSSCDWPAYWSPDRLRRLLRGRWLLFVGDSTTMELAVTMTRILTHRRFNARWNVVHTHRLVRSHPEDRGFDALIIDANMHSDPDPDPDPHSDLDPDAEPSPGPGGQPRPDRGGGGAEDGGGSDLGSESERAAQSGTRVSFVWNAHERPEEARGYGASAMTSRAFRDRLARILSRWPHRRRPDALVLNSGLHDLYGPISAGNLSRYGDQVRVAMRALRNISPLPIWKQTSPKRRELECSVFAPERAAQADVLQLNRVARHVATEEGYMIADTTAFNNAFPLAGDAHHCRETLPCDVFTLSLFNFFHSHWSRNNAPSPP